MAFAVARPGFDVAGIDTVVVGWLIDEDTKSELRGQWQQAVLDLAFAWVVRDLDGIEATKLFREREARETSLMRRMDAGHLNPRACIVAITAHALTGDRERCLAAGMDDYLPKPYTIEDLRRMLEKWIG